MTVRLLTIFIGKIGNRANHISQITRPIKQTTPTTSSAMVCAVSQVAVPDCASDIGMSTRDSPAANRIKPSGSSWRKFRM